MMNRRILETNRRRWALLGFLLITASLLLTACGAGQRGEKSSAKTATAAPTDTPEPRYRYNQLLSRDSIRPIYEPEFIPAAQAKLNDDELVLAIALGGEAKAYPITVLNSREMVNDELAGTPILATW